MKKVFTFILLFTNLSASVAQDKFWIELKDKGNQSISAKTKSGLSQNALNRRLYFNLPIDQSDWPLAPEYLKQIELLDADIKKQSKWLNGLVVQSFNPNFIDEVSQFPFVKNIRSLNQAKNQEIAKFQLQERAVTSEPNLGYGFASTGIRMLQGEFLHEQGFLGQPIDIAVMDNGFQYVNTNRFFDTLNLLNKIQGVYNFVDDNINVFSEGDHGAYVMSTLAANIRDTLVGTAPMGNYYLFTTEDNNSEGLAEEINWALAAEWADSALGNWVVLSTSLGYSNGFSNPSNNHSYSDMDGNTTIITRAADLAAKKGLLVVNSAGNEGTSPWKYITAPADGDSVLAVGAVNSDREITSFSSFGPSADGRVKPNVSALGRRVIAAKYDGTLQSINGTSFSCPITAGLAACLWQAFPDRTNMEVLKAIEQSAHLYFDPEDQFGFGIPNFKKAFEILQLKEANESNGLIVYPNPAKDILNLVFIDESVGSYDFLLSDMNGKVWIKRNEQSATLISQLKVQDLPNGVYNLFVQQGKKKFRQKFIKR